MEEKRFSGLVGDEYDLFILGTPPYEKFHDIMATEIQSYIFEKKLKTPVALDIGSGFGYSTNKVLQRNPDLTVMCIDNELKMFEKAKVFLQKPIKQSKVKLVEMDALEFLLSLDSASINIAYSGWTIHNWKKEYRQKFYQELYRVLKEGGVFLNADKYAKDDDNQQLIVFLKQISTFFKVFLELNRYDILEDWIKHYIIDESSDRIMRETESKNILMKIGFNDTNFVLRKNMESILITKK